MAKRTRYPGRTAPHRQVDKGGSPKSATPRPSGLTASELARAAELEAELVARDRAATEENSRRRARTRGGMDVVVAANASEPLSVRASHEYAYVARDVKRIAITATFMFGVLAALWLLVNVGGVGLF
ncbi:MAG: hypothetical protein ABI598_03170 [Chloroflexota bacterium]